MNKITVKHPHITQHPDISQGSPVIKGTRTRLIDIVIEYEYIGKNPDEIIDAHPHLNLAQVHDAISYYYDYREKLDREIDQRREEIESRRAELAE